MSLFNADGSVSPSSMGEAAEWLKDRSMPVLLGIVISIKPSDDKENYASQNHDDGRGYRHECTVLASDYLGKQPDLLITNVIIPPNRHSGIDNYEEDLPRGCSAMIDGSEYKDNFRNVDYSKLDGEWCLVSFIGGNIENPFIIGWWPHPSNVFDPATTGLGNDGKALKQIDTTKNRPRFIRRINGTQIVVNQQGSVYLDTSEANSTVKVKDGKLTRTLVDKGGHLQLDLSKKAQFEINFNEKEHKNPRIGAGSTAASPVTDVELAHTDQPVSGKPKARETKRSYTRWKEFEALLKTSGLTVFCEDTSSETDGKTGDFTLQAHTSVTIAQQADGGTAATVSIKDGKIQVVGSDGTQINVLSDEIQLVNKSGSMVTLKGGVATISAATISAVGALAVSGTLAVAGNPPVPAPQPGLLGTTVSAAFTTLAGTVALAGAAHKIAMTAADALSGPAKTAAESAGNRAFIEAFYPAWATLLGTITTWVTTKFTAA